jgi:hypothetical protein
LFEGVEREYTTAIVFKPTTFTGATFFWGAGLTTQGCSYILVSQRWAVAIRSPIDLRWQSGIVLGTKSGK